MAAFARLLVWMMILMDERDNVKYVYKSAILKSCGNNRDHGSALAKLHSLVREKRWKII